ncbi:MAG: FKBP-type peptidyl-prolyl cis-trans isomerase [Patescibacteria group bacterium]|jgi:FKBP-type peptidyl-prolyl cis-trans isomerase
MRFLSFLFLVSFFCFISCSQNGNSTKENSNNKNTTTEATGSAEVKTVNPIANGTEGVTASGYRYKFHISTNGIKPEIGDQVRYHEIVFKNDSLVSSTFYRFEPTLAIIPPLTEIPNPPPPNYEGVMMMSPGDSLTVFHDLDTISAPNLPKWLKNSDVLRYEIKMVSHQPRSAISAGLEATKARVSTVGDSLRIAIADLKSGKLAKQMIKTESGVSYIIHEEGKGDALEAGKYLQVHYMGMLQENGVSFNNTFGPAKAFAFQVGRGRVIKGWDEALLKIKKGGKMTIFVPYAMGYGEAGRPGKEGEPAYIPERADLAFYVEIVDVK